MAAVRRRAGRLVGPRQNRLPCKGGPSDHAWPSSLATRGLVGCPPGVTGRVRWHADWQGSLGHMGVSQSVLYVSCCRDGWPVARRVLLLPRDSRYRNVTDPTQPDERRHCGHESGWSSAASCGRRGRAGSSPVSLLSRWISGWTRSPWGVVIKAVSRSVWAARLASVNACVSLLEAASASAPVLEQLADPALGTPRPRYHRSCAAAAGRRSSRALEHHRRGEQRSFPTHSVSVAAWVRGYRRADVRLPRPQVALPCSWCSRGRGSQLWPRSITGVRLPGWPDRSPARQPVRAGGRRAGARGPSRPPL